MTEPSRPVLRWHGGKWLLAPWIIAHFPPHRIYVEPFGGAASVLLRKPRAYAEVWNDLDSELVNLFRVLRGPEAGRLIEQLQLTPFAREEFTEAHEQSGKPVERARRLVVRSFLGHGTSSATSRSGFRGKAFAQTLTPSKDWANYPDALPVIIERMLGVVIENEPAISVVHRYDRADALFYLDPPYHPGTRDDGRDYRHELDAADHSALLEALRGLAGMVVLSGYPHPLYDAALDGWRRVERAALADGARERVEVLWINPAAAAALDRQAAGEGSPLFAQLEAAE